MRFRTPGYSAIVDLAKAYWHRQTMVNRSTGQLYTPAEAQEYIRERFPGASSGERRQAYAEVVRAMRMESELQRAALGQTFVDVAKRAKVKLPADRVGARIDVTTYERMPDGTLRAYHTNTLYVEVGVHETLQDAMDRALEWAERVGRNYGLTDPPTGRFVGPTLWPGQTPGV